MSIEKYNGRVRRDRSEVSRERNRRNRVVQARNNMVKIMFGVFFLAMIIFALVRWVFPSEEGPISIPSEPSAAPSVTVDQEPSSSPTQALPSASTPASQSTAAPSQRIPVTKTDTSYTSSEITVDIQKKTYTSERGDTVYFVADIKCDPSYFRTALSGEGNKLSRDYEGVSEIAGRVNALIAINCDNAAYQTGGIIVRGGVLYRFKPSDRELFMHYKDGTMKTVPESSFKNQEMIEAEISKGLTDTFTFGPHLVSEGKGRGDYSDSNVQTYNPRTAVGIVEKGHYKLIVVDGRTDYNKGVRLIHLEEICLKEGMKEAYNMDGGQSSTMVFDGKLVNDIAGRTTERGICDIIYFPYAPDNE